MTFIDVVILGILFLIFIYPKAIEFTFKFKTLLPFLIFYIFFLGVDVFLVVRFGGTVGKLLFKVRIINKNGTYLTISQAILRQLINIISYITFLLFLWYYLHYIKTNIIVGSFIDIGKEMTIKLGNKYLIINNAVSLLQFADVFIILINYKKRAIHDYMAGSFVVFKNRKTKA